MIRYTKKAGTSLWCNMKLKFPKNKRSTNDEENDLMNSTRISKIVLYVLIKTKHK